MKLATYKPSATASFRVGVVADGARITPLLSESGRIVASDVGDLVAQGDDAMQAAEKFAGAALADSSVYEWNDIADVILGPPVLRPGKILAIGQNYRSHIREVHRAKGHSTEALILPKAPKVFMKASSELVGTGAAVRYPPLTSQLDYEAELVAVVGAPCYCVEARDAMPYVAGYTVMNDLSMRDIQFGDAPDGPLFGKNFPGAAPCGPFFVSAQEFGDPGSKLVQTIVNGEVRQDSNTADMVFSVAALVEHCSRIGLEPGDLISTGTPGGVGVYQEDADTKLLHRGDQVCVRVEGIGELITLIE